MQNGLGTILRTLRALSAPEAGDAELLERFTATRDEAAFAALVERHGPLVLSVCRRVLHNSHDAEDAFQATFLVLARKAALVRRRSSLASWLYGTAYRSAMEMKRQIVRRRRREERSQRSARVSDQGSARVSDPADQGSARVSDPAEIRSLTPPNHDLDLRELQVVVDEEVERLPEKYRSPFVLCCLQGRSKSEAAAELGWKEGTVSGRLAKAREILQRRLTQRGVTLSAGLSALALAPEAAAKVPAALVAAATQIAEGGAAKAAVAAVAQQVVRTLFWTRAKVGAVLVAVCSLTAVTGGVVGSVMLPTQHTEPPQAPVEKPERLQEVRQARTDLYGDPLPEGAIARLGTVRFRHGWRVGSVTYSPDGKVLATTGFDGLCLWDSDTGKPMPGWPMTEVASSVVFSSNCQMLAVAIGHDPRTKLTLFDVATAKETSRLQGNTEQVHPKVFSPDSKVLVASDREGRLHMWDVNTGEQTKRLRRELKGIGGVAFSPDGKILALGGKDKAIHLFQWETGHEFSVLQGHEDSVGVLIFSPDGRTLASKSEDKTIRLWNVAGRKLIRQFADPHRWFSWIRFSPDGQRLIRFAYNSFASHTGMDVAVFDVATGAEVQRLPQLTANASPDLSPDGKTLAAIQFGESTPRFWDLHSGKLRKHLGGHRSTITELAFANDGKSAISSDLSRMIIRWDLRTGQGRQVSHFEEGKVARSTCAPDQKTIATFGWWERLIQLWDAASGTELCVLGRHNWDSERAEPPRRPISFSADGNRLACVDQSQVQLWEVSSRQRHVLQGLEGPVYCVAFAPDGRTVAAGAFEQPNPIAVWDVATGNLVRKLGQAEEVYSLSFSPNGKWLAAAYLDAKPKIWDVVAGREMRTLAGPPTAICLNLAFSADSKLVVGAATKENERPVYIWEVLTGKVVRRFVGHETSGSAVAFAPNGTMVASGSGDSSILLWDVTGRMMDSRLLPEKPTGLELDRLWQHLAGEAGEAYDSVWTLAAAPAEALPFLRVHLRPASAADPQQVRRLLNDLDRNEFSERDRAAKELENLGELAEPALREALRPGVSLELRRRIERLLTNIHDRLPRPEQLRALRALQVLEVTGTAEARQDLQTLAAGAPEARLTQEAKASLDRLK